MNRTEGKVFRAISAAVNKLKTDIDIPQFIQSLEITINGDQDALENLLGTPVPRSIAGLEVQFDYTVPQGKVWVRESRSQKHAEVKVR